MKTKLLRTDSSNLDFQNLVRHLDDFLAERDGDQHAFYDQFNKIDSIKNAIVAHRDGVAAGCGAFKFFAEKTVEIKRMFVAPEQRGQGVATAILGELEAWATELGFEKAVLETVKDDPEAIGLYQKCGYKIIPNFGQYAGVENSACLEKNLKNC